MDQDTSPQLTDVIRLRVTENPKQVGSKSRLRFALYADGMTVGQYIEAVRRRFGDVEAGKCFADLQWDSDANRAFIRVERNGKPITLRRTASMSYGRNRGSAGPRVASRSSIDHRAESALHVPSDQSRTTKLDDELLSSYCQNFFGYGNFGSRFWFIGKQEGGGKDLDEAARRLRAWDALGRPALADLDRFHRDIGDYRWTGTAAQIQKTWEPFMRIVLDLIASPAGSIRDTDVVTYQRNRLGRLNGDNCVVDLLPLATRGISYEHWKWHNWSRLTFLRDPISFQKWIIPKRIARIRSELQKLDLVRVIFFGTQNPFPRCWQEICQVELRPARDVTYRYRNSADQPVLTGSRGNRKFLVLPHPNARIVGDRVKFWHRAAQLLT